MPPAIIAERYHVLRELGRGGMGVVYQVLRTETSQQYALKVLLAHKTAKGDSVERFKRELKLPAHIKSEHVVQVIDSGEVPEESDAPFYVMELLRGCDLRKLLDTNHAFTTREIIWILRQLVQGLSKAHEIGIVHRDLKPDNIFLHCQNDHRLVVKILDFGIARFALDLLDTGDKEKLTATQAMLGTPLYMAPEQAKGGEGRAEIAACTDLWAMGMIVFELLTGKTYWNANSLVAHIGQLLFAPMVPPSQRAKELPAGFDAWFARSCNRDTSQRYHSIAEQIEDLAKILATVEVEAKAPSALLTAVMERRPPLVDHSEETLIAPFPKKSAAVQFQEQNVRAEILPRDLADTRSQNAIKLKIRAALGGILVLSLGVFALVISLRKPSTTPDVSKGAIDAGTMVNEPSSRIDLAAPAALAPSTQPTQPVTGRQPSGTKPKRPPKAGKSHELQDEPPKSRRTCVPPSL